MTRKGKPDSIRNLIADLLTVFPETSPQETPYGDHMARLAGEHRSGGLILGPDGGFREQAGSDKVAGGETLIEDAQIGRVFEMRFENALTATETLVLRALIAGHSIREISKRDAVSHETRRNQLKAIMAKAGISRQVDLVAIMSTLLAMAALKSARDEALAPVHAFLERFHGQGLRIYSPHLAGGRQLLLLERGPVDGRPVLHMHSGFFPILPIDNARLEKIGIRIITPLRPGYFGLPVDWKADANARAEAFAEDLATLLRDFRLDRIPVFAQAHGAIAAVALCARLGTRIERLILHAALVDGQEHERHAGSFQTAHKGLARKAPRMLVRAYGFLGGRIVQRRNLDQVLRKIYGHSAADMQVLEDPERRAWIQALFSDISRLNGRGIVSDSQLHQAQWFKALAHLPIPRTLIYGDQERHSNFDLLAARCAEIGVEMRIIPGEGMLSMLFGCEDMLREAAGLSIEQTMRSAASPAC